MKLRFGKQSESNLETVHFALQYVAREALSMELIDFTVVTGFRSESIQNELFNNGLSKVRWPHGKHNVQPYSEAFDAYPYVNGKISYNYHHCIFLAGVILTCSKKLSVPIRWGGNWDMDLEIMTDQDFQDLGHFELIK